MVLCSKVSLLTFVFLLSQIFRTTPEFLKIFNYLTINLIKNKKNKREGLHFGALILNYYPKFFVLGDFMKKTEKETEKQKQTSNSSEFIVIKQEEKTKFFGIKEKAGSVKKKKIKLKVKKTPPSSAQEVPLEETPKQISPQEEKEAEKKKSLKKKPNLK